MESIKTYNVKYDIATEDRMGTHTLFITVENAKNATEARSGVIEAFKNDGFKVSNVKATLVKLKIQN